MLQRTIGNQATLRFLAQRAASLIGNEPASGHEHEADPENMTAREATRGIAWDFSKIPTLPLGRPNVHQPGPPLTALPVTDTIQPKLAVGQIDDPLEHEADRVADQVVSIPDRELSVDAAPMPLDRKCAACTEDAQLLRKKSDAFEPVAAKAPSLVHEVLRARGQLLDAATRADFEPRFGHDFSRVRIHTDTEAAQSAGQLHASAYTLGDHVVFAEGRFAPSTPAGDRLLAHELAHVVQGPRQNAILRRQPDPKGPHTQPEEARLRVRIADALEETKQSAVNAVASAIERGDRAYLEGLKLTSGQVNDLLNHTPQYNMEFGTAVERRIEQTVRADPFLSQYVKRGPTGRVPRGVGKPDWRIETPSSSIPVELTTREQIEQKLEMWRRQSPRGKAKWYTEKSLNLVYDILGRGSPAPSPTGPPVEAPGAAIQEIAQVATKVSRFRTAGRFLAREAPGLALQALLMLLFPPGVNIHNDKADELSRTKLDPAVEDALAKQEPVFDKLIDDDISKSIYANVTARLDYAVGASQHADLELSLKDITFLEAKITNEDITLSDPKFNQTGSRNVSKQITYSLLLYEPEYVTRDREWARAQQEYQECLQRYGTGGIPPAAGAEAAAASQRNPEEGPCIPPHMKPMEGP